MNRVVNVFLFICGLILFVSAGLVKNSLTVQSTFFDNTHHLYVEVMGESYEEACKPHIKIDFNDDGEMHMNISNEEGGANIVWLRLVDFDGFEWKSEGSVDNIVVNENESEGYSVSGKVENNSMTNIEMFRINCNDNATIHLKVKEPYYQDKYYMSIHTPMVCAVIPDSVGYKDKYNFFSELIKYHVINSENIEQSHKLAADLILQVGHLGNTSLYTAIPKIDINYYSVDIDYVDYEFHAYPEDYNKSTGITSWVGGVQQLYPSVEYINRNALNTMEKLVNILFFLGSFLLSKVIIVLIMYYVTRNNSR